MINRPVAPHRLAKGTRELREFLRESRVTMVFQPIVLLSRGTLAAYEAPAAAGTPISRRARSTS